VFALLGSFQVDDRIGVTGRQQAPPDIASAQLALTAFE
jgi:hypothetical protein